MGLTQGATVIQNIPEDGMITYDNVHVADTLPFRLLQEHGVAGAAR